MKIKINGREVEYGILNGRIFYSKGEPVIEPIETLIEFTITEEADPWDYYYWMVVFAENEDDIIEIDYGDGTVEVLDTWGSYDNWWANEYDWKTNTFSADIDYWVYDEWPDHTYSEPGTYTIKIKKLTPGSYSFGYVSYAEFHPGIVVHKIQFGDDINYIVPWSFSSLLCEKIVIGKNMEYLNTGSVGEGSIGYQTNRLSWGVWGDLFLEEIEVHPENSRYKVVDDVLYDMLDKKSILCTKNTPETLTIPKEIECIFDYSLAGLTSKHVVFEEGTQIKLIRYDAFNGSLLEDITIPKGVEGLVEGCFANIATFTGQEPIQFESDSNLIKIERIIQNTPIEQITIPNKVEEITIEGSSLNKLFFEEGGTAPLKFNTSQHSSVREIHFPDRLNEVVSQALAFCSNIEYIKTPFVGHTPDNPTTYNMTNWDTTGEYSFISQIDARPHLLAYWFRTSSASPASGYHRLSIAGQLKHLPLSLKEVEVTQQKINPYAFDRIRLNKLTYHNNDHIIPEFGLGRLHYLTELNLLGDPITEVHKDGLRSMGEHSTISVDVNFFASVEQVGNTGLGFLNLQHPINFTSIQVLHERSLTGSKFTTIELGPNLVETKKLALQSLSNTTELIIKREATGFGLENFNGTIVPEVLPFWRHNANLVIKVPANSVNQYKSYYEDAGGNKAWRLYQSRIEAE